MLVEECQRLENVLISTVPSRRGNEGCSEHWSKDAGNDPRELKKSLRQEVEKKVQGPSFQKLVDACQVWGRNQATQTDETQDGARLPQQVGEPDDARTGC